LEFAYDHQSRRVSKRVYEWDGSSFILRNSSLFVYDAWNLITELTEVSGQMSVVRSHVWGLDLSGTEQGAGGVGGLLFTTSHLPLASSHFACFDGNGNVSALVDTATGTLAAEYEYDPFGNLIARIENPASSIQNPFLFSTKYTDTETGLLYYGYRYYQPSTGRWLSRDPIGETAFSSLYMFVGNMAVSTIDLLGLADMRMPSSEIGYFVGERGNSQFLFKTGTEQARLFPKGFRFVDGFPDLSDYTAKFTVAGKTVVADVMIPQSKLEM
jgi:RHS repeat-associated protein